MPRKSSSKKDSKSVIVTVTDAKLKNIQQVAEDLTAQGMNVTRVMPITGVITGSCSSAEVSDLEQVDGVESVEEEATAYFSPSGASAQ